MKINIVNQNFKGYTNPLSNTVGFINGMVHVLSVQMDNIETSDLNKFREIKQELDFPHKEIEGDVLTMTYMEDLNKNKHRFYLNGKPMLLGTEMRMLEEYNYTTKAEKDMYIRDKKAHIKMYTFLARITKQMKSAKSIPVDDDMSRVTRNTIDSLAQVFKNEVTAFNVVQDALFNVKPFQYNSMRINEYIKKTMECFFEEGKKLHI